MKNEIVALEQEVTHIASKALQFSITSTERLTEASGTREWLKEKIKFLKGHKELLYRPYKNKIDAINEVYKPIEKMLTDAEKAISTAMSDYQTSLLKAKEEAEAKIAARVKEGRGNLSASSAMAKMDALEAPVELEMTGFSKKQVLVITDVNLIPREFLIVDEKLVEATLKAGTPVPGATLETKLIPKSR